MDDSAVRMFAKLLGFDDPAQSTKAAVTEALSALKPFYRGQLFARAVDEGYFPSTRKLGDVIGSIDAAHWHLTLARLPSSVVQAFPNPGSIRLPWIKKINPALLRDPDLLLARAKEIAQRRAAGEKIPALVVYRELLNGSGI
jgi:ParB family chromosome partitioning protein